MPSPLGLHFDSNETLYDSRVPINTSTHSHTCACCSRLLAKSFVVATLLISMQKKRGNIMGNPTIARCRNYLATPCQFTAAHIQHIDYVYIWISVPQNRLVYFLLIYLHFLLVSARIKCPHKLTNGFLLLVNMRQFSTF